jgi:hypothetical protein
MDQDLQELLALWLSDADPGEARREALLARLRGDEAFRRDFVEEIRLLGMIEAVQSPEPRWLRLEDETGWSAPRPAGEEALAQRVVRLWERRRRARRWLRRSLVAVAASALLAVGLYLGFRPTRPPAPGPEAPGGVEVATVIGLDGVEWEDGGEPLKDGAVVSAGRLRFRRGRLTLAFFSGVSMTVEGPADLELLAAGRVSCHRGRLRARVPRGAEGFTVLAPGLEVLDLGTEFALNLEPGGKSRVMVFQGEAAVSVLGKDGRSVRGQLLERRRSVEVDPGAGRIHDVAAEPGAFVPLTEFVPPPLALPPGYADEVLAGRPWGYWRFDALVEGRVPNRVKGRPGLRPLGGVALGQSPGGSCWAHFRPLDPAQGLLMDGEWSPPRAAGYALELWVQADLPSPNAFAQTALVGLIDRDDREAENHLAYLELTARGRRSPHEPCAVRFLDRWPASTSGGADVFSRRTVVPSRWHHVVGQKSKGAVELYVDGERVGTTPAKAEAKDPATTACRLLVGRLKRKSHLPFTQEVRAFEGRLGELAVYDRPLTPEEVRRHARLGGAAP